MKLIPGLIPAILACLASLEAQPADTVKYKILDPYYFHLQYLKEEPALLIDVREPFEYRGRRIKDAVNVPSPRYLNIVADTLGKECSLFLYCTTDTRAIRAAELFYDKGFRKIYLLEGGIMFWRKEGMPVEKGRIGKKRKQAFSAVLQALRVRDYPGHLITNDLNGLYAPVLSYRKFHTFTKLTNRITHVLRNS